MKNISLTICSLFLFLFSQAQASDTLTNDAVIKLYKSGFSIEVIKSKINTSPAKFDVSIDGMMKLKDNKVPDDVINLMVSNPSGNAAKSTQAATTSAVAGNVNTGIFYINAPSENVEMNPSFIASRKTDRTSQIFLSTLVDAEIRVILNENHAAMQTTSMPKFQFVFDTVRSNNENPWFGRNSSPKNFFLVKLKATKKTRELVVGTTSAVQDQIEIKDKQKIPVKSRKTGAGVWEVSPISPLEPGEYGIVFSNAIWDTQSGKIYDFSVK